jgi:hypothetical protein
MSIIMSTGAQNQKCRDEVIEKETGNMEQAFQGKKKEWAKVIAQAWVDEDFKSKLLADPKAVLKAEGIEFPENVKVNMAEAKEDELNLTLPLKPADFTGSKGELQERIQASPWWAIPTVI